MNWYGTPPKRKRKNDELNLGDAVAGGVRNFLMIIGLTTLVLGSLMLFSWAQRSLPHSSPARPTIAVPQVKPVDTLLQPALEADPAMIFSTRDGRIRGRGLSLNLMGSLNAVSPDGKTLLYTRNGALYVWRTQLIGSPIQNVEMAAFNASGDAVIYEKSEAGQHGLYQLNMDGRTVSSTFLTTTTGLLVPPIAHPATGGILVTERNGEYGAAFYILTQDRDTSWDKKLIGTSPYGVDSADFHPSGVAILYTAAGNVYLLHTADGTSERLFIDGLPRYQTKFSPDGTRIAFLDRDTRMHIVRVSDFTEISGYSGSFVNYFWTQP